MAAPIKTTVFPPELYEYVSTDIEREALKAIETHGSLTAASRSLGMCKSYCSKKLGQVKKRAARAGFAPGHFESGTAPGYLMGMVTVQRGPSGEVERTYERQLPDQERALEVFSEVIEGLAEKIKGHAPHIPAPAQTESDLLTVIPMGDPHFGLLSWKPETGEDFNTAKAEAVTFGAVDRLTAATPGSKTGLLLNLGDYFHADDSTNRTPRGGNALDTDTRFAKIAEIGFRAMVRCVERMLEKHETVIVRNNPGNHDPHQAKMLNIAVGAYFHNEPRVMVDPSPSSFYFLRFGKCLIGSTHGDGAKLGELPMIMANDAPEDWAAARFRVWHVGHFHHNQKLAQKDLVGCEVETHRTLAAGDAWHRHEGYRSLRDMKAITYHREFGELSRIRVGIEQLEQGG